MVAPTPHHRQERPVHRNYILALALGSIGIAMLISAVALKLSRDSDTSPPAPQGAAQATPAPQPPAPRPAPKAAPAPVTKAASQATPKATPKPAPQPKPEPVKSRLTAMKQFSRSVCIATFQDGIMSVDDWREIQGESIIPVPKGFKRIAVKLGLVATTGEVRSNPLYIECKAPSGEIYNTVTIPPKPLSRLPTGPVDKGDDVLGWVAFDVPKSVDPAALRVRYQAIRTHSRWVDLRYAAGKDPTCNQQLEDIKKQYGP